MASSEELSVSALYHLSVLWEETLDSYCVILSNPNLLTMYKETNGYDLESV